MAVTTENIKDTVIKDGFLKPSADLHRHVRMDCAEVRHLH